MLDERTGALLFRITALCQGDGYRIIEEGELVSCYPEGQGRREALHRALSYLRERGYIDMKYAEEGLYCVCVLPDGRLYAENVVREKTNRARSDCKTFFIGLFSSFLGSVLGAFLACLVAV